MGLNWGGGLLKGMEAAGESYAGSLKKKSERDYDDQKASVLYTRQVSMERMRTQNNKDVAETTQGYTEKNIQTRSGAVMAQDKNKAALASGAKAEERKLLRAEETAAEYEAARREASMHPDFPEDQVGQDAFIKKVADNKWLATQLATKGIDKSVQVQLIKSADEAWLNMDEDAKDKLIAKAGGDEVVAKGRYAAQNVKSWKDVFGIKKPTRINPDITPEEQRLQDEEDMRVTITGAGSRKKALALISNVTDKDDLATWMASIDAIWPDKKKGGSSAYKDFMDRTTTKRSPDSFVSRELSRPTALSGMVDLYKKSKPGTAVTAPLKSLLGQGLDTEL